MAIGDALSNHIYLQMANFGFNNNNIGNLGAQSIATGYKNMNLLTYFALGINHNDIDDKGVQYLTDAYKNQIHV